MQDQNLLKEALKKYKKSNYHIQSWSEYSKELNKLTDKIVTYVQVHKLNVDAVVPILRGGNIPGTFIAYALDILTILPVQYKYFFVGKKCELRKMFGINKEMIFQNAMLAYSQPYSEKTTLFLQCSIATFTLGTILGGSSSKENQPS